MQKIVKLTLYEKKLPERSVEITCPWLKTLINMKLTETLTDLGWWKDFLLSLTVTRLHIFSTGAEG